MKLWWRDVPREVEFRGIYVTPLLPSAILGVIAAWFTARWLNSSRLAVHFEQPLLAFVAFSVIYTIIFSALFFPS